MAKPSEIPYWATEDLNNGPDGGPNVVVPPTGTQETGWLYSEKPPREYFNWLARRTGEWIAYLDSQTAAPVGAKIEFYGTDAPAGYLIADGSTIGNTGSGATTLADDVEAWPLFEHLWNSFDNTLHHVQNNAGTPTTRGASALADFEAEKRMPLPEWRGEFSRAVDAGRGIDTSRAVGTAQSGTVGIHRHPTLIPQDGAGSSAAYPYDDSNFGGSVGTSGDSGKWRLINTDDNTSGTTENIVRNIAFLWCIRYA